MRTHGLFSRPNFSLLRLLMATFFAALRPGGMRASPGRPSIGGGARPSSGQGASVTRRSGAIAALNTLTSVNVALDGSTSPIVIPGGVTRIVRVDISVVLDLGTTAISQATMSGVALSGLGVGSGGLHEFAGPGLSYTGFGTSTGAFAVQALVSYDTDIAVGSGSTPTLQAAFMGDVTPVAGYVQVTLQYA